MIVDGFSLTNTQPYMFWTFFFNAISELQQYISTLFHLGNKKETAWEASQGNFSRVIL